MYRSKVFKVFLIISSLFVTFMFHISSVSAKSRDIELIQIVDKYVFVEKGNLVLRNEDSLRKELSRKRSFIRELNSEEEIDAAISVLKSRFRVLNLKADLHQITIEKSKRIVNNNLILRSGGRSSSYYWWGVRHIFYSDSAARDYAYNVRMNAHVDAGAAALAGAIFGGIGALPSGLSALYAYSIADTVDYNANRPGNGVILDVNWWLTYRCYPR